MCFDLRYLFPYTVNHICLRVKMLQSVYMQWYEDRSFHEQGKRSSELWNKNGLGLEFIWLDRLRNKWVYLWFLYIAALYWRFVLTAVGGCSSAGRAGSWGTLALAGLAQHGANEPFSIDSCRTQLEQVLLITWARHTHKHINRTRQCDVIITVNVKQST